MRETLKTQRKYPDEDSKLSSCSIVLIYSRHWQASVKYLADIGSSLEHTHKKGKGEEKGGVHLPVCEHLRANQQSPLGVM